MIARMDSSLAAGCVRTARHLMDRGFFEFERPGGFALTFTDGPDDLFGVAVPACTGWPNLMLLRGPDAFPAFVEAMMPSARTNLALFESDFLGVGYRRFAEVPEFCLPFLREAGPAPRAGELTPYFVVEPPRSERRGPDRGDAELILLTLNSLAAGHERGPIPFLPLGERSGDLPAFEVSGDPFRPQVELQAAPTGFGVGPDDLDAIARSL